MNELFTDFYKKINNKKYESFPWKNNFKIILHKVIYWLN